MNAPEPIRVRYTNWRGETAERRLIPSDIRYGTTEWHPEPTWLLTAFDLDHPAQIWKDFDLAKCDFVRADLPPTDAEVMNHPKVKALVDAAGKVTIAIDEMTSDDWCGDIDQKAVRKALHESRAALAAIQEDRG